MMEPAKCEASKMWHKTKKGFCYGCIAVPHKEVIRLLNHYKIHPGTSFEREGK